ncbi:apicoplast pyruvate carrier 1-like [Saccoglossus kowalevskii]|uniref:Uncharacterized protein LOC102801812 n=1 Tax=Saccoglossus kowalevskii TaxID=10224 RepID=A0ABM0M0N0_SACKO|nr:PREDICTED: uncharacterized protein LOC102801812 [Saccoglossus kowalevskii]
MINYKYLNFQKLYIKWFPEKKGVACGCIVAGFGGGAFIFNFVQTSFINPNNLSPTVEENGEQYFGSDEVEVLDRTPYCFLLLGGCYIVMQIIGSLLLVDPQYHGKVIEEEEKLLVSINSEPEDIRWSGITIRRKEMLKTRAFWTLWLTFMANTQTSVLVATLYKAFGQTFISNDRLLSIVGSFASVCNCFGRIVWGHLADKFCFRDAMMLLCALNAAFLFTIVAVPEAGEVMFFIWVCSIFFMFSGNFSLFPTATARAFGKDYVGENYGLLFTSLIVASLIGTLSSSILSDVIGWTGIFFYCAGFSVFGLILTFTFNVKTPTGQHI